MIKFPIIDGWDWFRTPNENNNENEMMEERFPFLSHLRDLTLAQALPVDVQIAAVAHTYVCLLF